MPWRYGPALAKGVPAGVVAEPVLEVADGLRGRARIVVAVAEGEAPARLEIWDFSQRNPRELLERVDAPVVLLDPGRPGGEALATAALDQLRREMASPASESFRPLGLAASGDLPAWLAELARLAGEAAGAGPGRAAALARLCRGFDDQLLWSRRFPELLRGLASEPWEIVGTTPVGARRAQVQVRAGGRALQVELARKQERWVMVDVADAPG